MNMLTHGLIMNKYSDIEKIKYYQSRVKDNNLKPMQRKYAYKRLKELKGSKQKFIKIDNYQKNEYLAKKNKYKNLIRNKIDEFKKANYYREKDFIINNDNLNKPKYLVINPSAYEDLRKWIKQDKEFQKNNYLERYYYYLQYVKSTEAKKLAKRDLKQTLNVDYYGLYYDYY